MIPNHRLPLGAVIVSCLLLSTLSGCEIFKKSEAVQQAVNQRVVGMQIGAFFDRFGPPFKRTEQEDRSTVYLWISAVGPVAAGQLGEDDRTCTLRIVASPLGKIVSADVAVDNPGHVSASRCAEIMREHP